MYINRLGLMNGADGVSFRFASLRRSSRCSLLRLGSQLVWCCIKALIG